MTEIIHKLAEYQVIERQMDEGWLWLSIKKLNKNPIHDWRELQKIKNLIAGKEREAVELYPSESRLVDTSNQYHLFVLPKGEQFPFGYGERLIGKGHKGDSKQRPFKKGEEPKDALTKEELDKLRWFKLDKFLGGKN